MLHYIKLLTTFFIILFTIANLSCKDNITGPFVPEDEIIGTWQLTKIYASYTTGQQELTPEQENISFKITLNGDKTYQRNQDYNGDVINDNGTWSLSNSNLTLSSASGSITFLIKVNGGKLQVSTNLPDPNSGLLVPVTLEFTRQ